MFRAWPCALVILAAPATAPAAPGGMAGDADQDGRLSAAEFKDSRSKVLWRADRDADGKLGPSEWIAGETRLRRETQTAGFDPRAQNLGTGDYGKVDADDDGFVSAGEADAYLTRRFESLDANRDGFVDRDEMRAARGR
ncbi:hypothetical protein [Phenylobacterium sp. J367]|uniref:hypothetical protein n=1 Tax=Phenylobacterium sp. J367 TaxID=2898435 RepID=UPI00215190EB|nr:hypothetical protein [Phenylobacterium sp. J367]MCR5877851.1 hypothetical protein [Phenylobacterium sp. J367]